MTFLFFWWFIHFDVILFHNFQIFDIVFLVVTRERIKNLLELNFITRNNVKYLSLFNIVFNFDKRKIVSKYDDEYLHYIIIEEFFRD